MTNQQFIGACGRAGVAPVIKDKVMYGVTCPYGKVLASTLTHDTFIWWNPSWDVSAIYAELIEELSMGTIDCPDGDDCDFCNE